MSYEFIKSEIERKHFQVPPSLERYYELKKKKETLQKELQETEDLMFKSISQITIDINHEEEDWLKFLIIRLLYWHEKDMPTTWLKTAFKYTTHEITRIAKQAETDFRCRDCGEKLKVRSREQLKRISRQKSCYSSDDLCPRCYEKRYPQVTFEGPSIDYETYMQSISN